jgi:hypothetical protein
MMRKLLAFFLLFFMSLSSAWGQLNANFSTNPLYNTSNQLNVCAGCSILFKFIWKLSFIAEETGDKIEKVGHVTKLKSDKDN